MILDESCLRVCLDPGSLLLVAVSGGADSMCLLYALHEVSARLRIRLEVAHVNHGIRGDAADADAAFVESHAGELGLPFHLAVLPDAPKPTGVTLEEYLRELRHERLAAIAAERDAAAIALGHTADDLVETFLMHLLRGAGPHGLSFSPIQAAGDCALVRPLWQTSRSTVLDFLASRELRYQTDETNASLKHTRNRIRHVLLPLLESEFNPSVREAIVRASRQIGQVQDYAEASADAVLQRVRHGSVLDRTRLRDQHPCLQREVLRSWLNETAGLRIPEPTLEQVIRAVTSTETRYFDLPSDHRLIVSGNLVGLDGLDALDAEMPLAVLEEALALTSDRPTVTLQLVDGRTLHVAVTNPDALGDRELLVRNRRPGDHISPSVRLKEILIVDKVPLAERDLLIIVAEGNGQVHAVAGQKRINGRIKSEVRVSFSITT